MSDWFSLSVLQILSVLSFVTSLLAVVRVGAGSFHRLQHKFDASAADMNVAPEVKLPMWNWKVSGLPVSFSLGSILGEDEQEETETGLAGYTGGSTLVRMDWQVVHSQSGMCSYLWSRVRTRLNDDPQYHLSLNSLNRHYQWPS